MAKQIRRQTRAGRRSDLENIYFRSGWEANYARWLNRRVELGEIRAWDYEPKRFYFPIKRGNKCYTPDFRIWLHDGSIEWHEIKGWMDNDSRIKLERFARHFPNETLVLVDSDVYRSLEKEVSGSLPNWE